uniref:Uncharacterized protein n=1 Tax=Oryza nivara TaxID=4536 RepID=A0A0E0IYB5_ORYNI
MAQQGHNMVSECVEKEQVSAQAIGSKSSKNKVYPTKESALHKGWFTRIETSINDKEVSFTVARWKEDNEDNIELIIEWFLVYGVPRIYRNWKELYQIVSAVGVLIDVDEESLLGEEPFSCHFMFGWYSRCVTFMIEDEAQTTKCERKVLEDCNGQDHLDEFGKEYRVKSDKAIEIPPEILNKEMISESSSNDTSIVVSTHNHTLDVKGWSDKEFEKRIICFSGRV